MLLLNLRLVLEEVYVVCILCDPLYLFEKPTKLLLRIYLLSVKWNSWKVLIILHWQVYHILQFPVTIAKSLTFFPHFPESMTKNRPMKFENRMYRYFCGDKLVFILVYWLPLIQPICQRSRDSAAPTKPTHVKDEVSHCNETYYASFKATSAEGKYRTEEIWRSSENF